MFLGAIADDVTGATDLASVLRRAGLTVVQTLDTFAIPAGADAVVVSLKIRTTDPAFARSSAGQAADALRAAGAEQIYFKYCSTFDSTDAGNIGPVIDELLARLQGPSRSPARRIRRWRARCTPATSSWAISSCPNLRCGTIR